MGFWCGVNEIVRFYKGSHLMFKKIVLILTIWLLQSVFSFASTTVVFVSFSMPQNLMDEVFKDASNHNVSVTLNGLIDDDFRKTLSGLFEFSKKYPNLSVQIDPYAFEKYHIDKVPALVVDDGVHHDVLYGNVKIEDGLLWLKRKGDVQ